jgi:hypothetical protein
MHLFSKVKKKLTTEKIQLLVQWLLSLTLIMVSNFDMTSAAGEPQNPTMRLLWLLCGVGLLPCVQMPRLVRAGIVLITGIVLFLP